MGHRLVAPCEWRSHDRPRRQSVLAALGAAAAAVGASAPARAQEAALAAPGPLLAGSEHEYELVAPELAHEPFVGLFSLADRPGIPTAAGLVGLAPDPLFVATSGAVIGTLDEAGRGAFVVGVPSAPSLDGLAVHASGAVLGAASRDGIAAIANTLTRRIRAGDPRPVRLGDEVACGSGLHEPGGRRSGRDRRRAGRCAAGLPR